MTQAIAPLPISCKMFTPLSAGLFWRLLVCTSWPCCFTGMSCTIACLTECCRATPQADDSSLSTLWHRQLQNRLDRQHKNRTCKSRVAVRLCLRSERRHSSCPLIFLKAPMKPKVHGLIGAPVAVRVLATALLAVLALVPSVG